MSNYAVCTNCESDDVEYIGLKNGEDAYYCHNCEMYFTIDWDEQDALDAQRDPEEWERIDDCDDVDYSDGEEQY